MKPATVHPDPSSYLDAFARTLQRVEVTGARQDALALADGLVRAVDLMLSLDGRGKALLIGNGGSAAIVSHMHNDLCKALGVRAMVFNEPPLLTALANDDGYHTVFHTPVNLWADAGDLFIAVSSSGESENIVHAAALARDKGCHLLTFTGFSPSNRLRQLGDLNIYVPDSSYGFVEMIHSVVGHCITDLAIVRKAARA